jgi:hypothetical protein
MQPKEKVMTFQKGQSGNPAGRPRGSRNRAAELGYSLLEKELTMVMDKVIELITAGNTAALKMYLDRIVPVQHGSCELPPLAKPADSIGAMTAIAEAVADGELAPSEAASVTRVVEAFAQAIELHDFDARITELERHDVELLRRAANGTKAPTQP